MQPPTWLLPRAHALWELLLLLLLLLLIGGARRPTQWRLCARLHGWGAVSVRSSCWPGGLGPAGRQWFFERSTAQVFDRALEPLTTHTVDTTWWGD